MVAFKEASSTEEIYSLFKPVLVTKRNKRTTQDADYEKENEMWLSPVEINELDIELPNGKAEVKTEKKDQATLIAELIIRVTSLEDDMKFALRHIKILEVDSGIEAIESWDEEDEKSIEEYTIAKGSETVDFKNGKNQF